MSWSNSGYASPEAVQAAIEEGRLAGRSAESLLLEQGQISAETLTRATAERYGLDHVDLSVYQVDFGAAALFPVTMARRYKAVPVGYIDQHTLLVATADPANVLAVDDVQIATGLDCQIAVASDEDVESLLSRLGTLQSAAAEAIIEEHDAEEGDEDGEAEMAEMQVSAADAPVIKLVYSILAQAVSEGASDVHLEPEEDELRVRFRIDGVLKEAAHVPRRMIGAVISRLKIMAELDIAEKRVPQDGRISVNIEERRIDLRVTTLPTQRGEGATIRILDESNAERSLDDLGMDGDARSRFEGAFRQAYGAVLVTGPTGSGKSTTLYAALGELNSVEKKIITIEDPVEYRIGGINQLGVNRKAGMDFARGLRSILRADPDIVMVGEIRDAETARIAIEAALTGHMMLSTLHTNDAPGAIARLNEMGIETFLTASAVDCVVAQRLSRAALPALQEADGPARRSCSRGGDRGRGRRRGLRAGRLLALRRQRLPRPGRDLLGDETQPQVERNDRQQLFRAGDRRRRPRRGNAHPPRARHREGSGGADQPRGGPPCHSLTSISPVCSAVWSNRTPPTST